VTNGLVRRLAIAYFGNVSSDISATGLIENIIPGMAIDGPHEVLGFTQSLTEMSTRIRKIMFLGSKTAAGA
jgi:hypothetical protein